jgi:hypothetical protein
MLAIGAIGFVGALLLGAYAPELGQYSRAGGHALSNGATGYSGLVRLAAATGRNPEILRDERQWDLDDLVVVTPEAAATNLNGMLGARFGELPTLYILPKWEIVADPDRRGWVRTRGLLSVEEPEGVFAPGWNFEIVRHEKPVRVLVSADPDLPPAIRFVPPASLQVISSQVAEFEDEEPGEFDEGASEVPDGRLKPIITDGSGGIVLGRIDGLFILTDPDLLDNAGLKRPENAAAALALLDWLNGEEAEAVGFDVVLNGIGGSRSILRLAFDPPFLALTLTLAAVVLLLALRAVGRFGAPRLRERAIAFGKAALVDNCAMLVRKAGRTHRLGGRYAAVVREQAIRAFGVSLRLKPIEVDAYLDGLGDGSRFTELATRAETANDDTGMLAAARALHMWKQEKLSDH